MKTDEFERDSFTFYASWENGISKIKDIQARESIYRAIVRYSLFAEEPDLSDPMAIMCWEFAKPLIDKARIRSKVSSVRKPSLDGNKNASKNEQNSKKTQTKNEQNSKKMKDKMKDKDNNIVIIADESATHKQYLEELSRDYPTVMSMREPLTYEQCMKLAEVYDRDKIRDVLSKMENYLPLKKNNKSAYRTALNWLNKDYGK